jgi:hypothetical protein
MTHTPGKLMIHPTRAWPVLVPVDDIELPVAKVDCSVSDTNRPYQEARANAERLAHCWNCHEDLLAALKAMLAHTEPNYGITGQQSVWNVARKVIADAEGK